MLQNVFDMFTMAEHIVEVQYYAAARSVGVPAIGLTSER